MNRKKLVPILITVGCIVVLVVLLHLGGGKLLDLMRSHFGG